MACASCAKKKANSYQDMKAIETPPFRATDITVYDIEQNEARKFQPDDWNTKTNNLLLFVPNVETIKEIGDTLGTEDVEVTYVTSQPLHQIKDYYENGAEKPVFNKIFVSYLLPSRTGLLYNGFTKKAAMFVVKDGDTSIQQLFYNSSFNYEALGQFLSEYLNDNH